jgi:hypothetical protein
LTTTLLFGVWLLVYLPCFVIRLVVPVRIGIGRPKSGRRVFVVGLFAFCLLWPSGSSLAYQTQSFPPAHEIFAPLQADPTELQFAFQWEVPVSHTGIARIDAGDYLGIYRWALGDVGALQLNVGGAVNSRFDATPSHNLQVIDYYGNVPLDLTIGRFSARSMFYHDSSHLGDDYLRQRGIEDMNNSWNALREVISVQTCKALRLYGGYTYAVNTTPAWSGRQAIQGGTEIYFNTGRHSFWHPYWANDIQAWARSNWDATWASQLGFKTGDVYSNGRGISYFVQFKTGPRSEGQFYQDKETIWGAGLKFVLSDHLFQASSTPATSIVPPAATP